MAWKQAKTYWNLAFLCGDVWALSRWLRPVGVTVPVNLVGSDYAALFTLFTGGLAIINWPWVRRLRRANRFYDLTAEIKAAHSSFMEDDSASWSGGRSDLTGKTRAGILVITHKLEALDVPCPPMDIDILRMWFPEIQSMAETKRLAAARAILTHLSVDAGPLEVHIRRTSQPTVTLTKAPRRVRFTNWIKKLWK